MTKHEEIKDSIFRHFHGYDEQETLIYQYINSCEATEKELSICKVDCGTYKMLYQELQRDVKRHIFLNNKIIFHKALDCEVKENKKIIDKLSKVGNE